MTTALMRPPLYTRPVTSFLPLFLAFCVTAIFWAPAASAADSPTATAAPLKVLLIDGQNNHKWKETTPVIVETLESGGFADVTIATTPGKRGDMSTFSPDFAEYDVVVSNYNGDLWSGETQRAFEAYMKNGGGFVSVHAADNSFPAWEAYNRMIGIGGWGGRNEKDGPYVRWKEDLQQFTRDTSKGSGGTHGRRVPFEIVVRNPDHPITKGLPRSFMQVADELYGRLRGPAENMDVLATAYSDPSTRGTGEHEPILMAIQFGKGRVFHSTLGHDVNAMKGLAFQTTLRRGTEWAATGKVDLPAIDNNVLTSTEAAAGEPADAADAEQQPSEADKAATLNQPPKIDGDGWQSIFNGESLEGWTQKNGTASYRVEDGIIIGKTAVGSPNSFLCSDESYENFELTFEVNVDEGLNSGVQIRSKTRDEGGRVYGPQVEIESAPGESGYIYGEATGRGWITKEQPIKDAYQNGKFNRYRVRAIGDRIQTWVNDTKISDIVDPESSGSGFIGLQVHGIGKNKGPYEVRWRDIRVRPIQ
ncbi:MAG: family 16 glycoside hydrolase [Rhodopirellula sp. JB044]|uniref:family 16 glycoside hydrolase n=1 Tax=Rhodopirellula sp. JB044 TaxID=3342844 RepID=UPI00370ADD4D